MGAGYIQSHTLPILGLYSNKLSPTTPPTQSNSPHLLPAGYNIKPRMTDCEWAKPDEK